MTHGFVKEGFNVTAGLDSDASCKYAYEHNNRATFLHKKIEDVQAEEILAFYPTGHIRVLIGCAPCQPFSKYTKNKPQGEKWKLLSSFSDVIDMIQPEIVSMENVTELMTFNDGAVYNDFVNRLQDVYSVTCYPVYCPNYGVPQMRTRLVLFASKFGGISLIEKTHSPERYKTVKDVIEGIPAIEAGQICGDDSLHRASKLSELNKRRIRQSVPGGSWRDWDEELIATCHKKDSGKSYGSVYGRMRWDEPAPTITTQCYGYGNGRFGHPEQDRAISLREAALLQTFPSNYEFVGPDDEWSLKAIGRHIGNAVPVDLGQVIARSIARHLEKQRV